MLRRIIPHTSRRVWLTQWRCLVQLARKQYLPGSEGSNFPEFLNEIRDDFPLIIHPGAVGITSKATPSECANAVKDSLQELLLKSGAVLYRGFPIHNASDFSTFFESLGQFKGMGYKGGQAVRDNVVGDVYTASNETGHYSIELHNEMAYLGEWPQAIIFYCDVPVGADGGGETCIADVRDIAQHLDQSVVEKFDRLGVMYHHHAACQNRTNYKSWETIFGTDDKTEVSNYLTAHDQNHEWGDDDSLSWWWTRPALIDHPDTGERLWFNHIHKKHATTWTSHPQWGLVWETKTITRKQLPTHTYYGDGSDISDDVVQHIRDASWKVAVGFQMQKCDCLFMENHFVQHARLSFTGPRRLLAVLAGTK